MKRLMAIDYGDVRVGVAISDPLVIFAQPYTTIKNEGFKKVSEKIIEIIIEKNVSKLIIGLPLNLKGENSQKTNQVEKFISKLEKLIDIPLIKVDERFSTVEANQEIKRMKLNIKEGRKIIDQIAASIILKRYIESIS